MASPVPASRFDANEPVIVKGSVRYYPELIQGSDEWLTARCGLLTASEMKLIVTPATLKAASNDKERAHLYELLAQRITGYVEPSYISDDMLRGMDEEEDACAAYCEHHAPCERTGFITNDRWGFTLGYSPDRIVGEDGLVEAKSRRQKYQIQTIVENVGIDRGETIPADFLVQVQTGLLVSERQWLDFISYSGGLPMAVIRCHPIPKVADAIVEISGAFEKRLAEKLAVYREASRGLVPTKRKVQQEMFV